MIYASCFWMTKCTEKEGGKEETERQRPEDIQRKIEKGRKINSYGWNVYKSSLYYFCNFSVCLKLIHNVKSLYKTWLVV